MTACLAATGSKADLVYLEDEWLAAQVVEAWTEIPIWIPKSEGPGVFNHEPAEAEAAGLRWRPLAETVADTWAWQQTIPGGWQPSQRTPGLDPAREQNLIEAWRSR
jgi:2'-hydroxyisoflavone reductase